MIPTKHTYCTIRIQAQGYPQTIDARCRLWRLGPNAKAWTGVLPQLSLSTHNAPLTTTHTSSPTPSLPQAPQHMLAAPSAPAPPRKRGALAHALPQENPRRANEVPANCLQHAGAKTQECAGSAAPQVGSDQVTRATGAKPTKMTPSLRLAGRPKHDPNPKADDKGEVPRTHT